MPDGKKGLLLLDGLGGAVSSASTALSAQVLVDLVMIRTLNDGIAGASAGAGAAGNAAVGDNEHGMYLLFGIQVHCNIYLTKCNRKNVLCANFAEIKEKLRYSEKNRAWRRYGRLSAAKWSGKVKKGS